METKASRTLVKSAPELWALADDAQRAGGWMAGLIDARGPVAVEVTSCEPQRSIAWRLPASGETIAIELAESGFGTAVEITARHSRPDPAQAIAALEDVLDELGSAGRRPHA